MPVSAAGLRDGLELDVVAAAVSQEPAGGVTDHVHGRVGDRGQEAVGLACDGKPEQRVDAGDVDVHRGAGLGVVVQAALRADVELQTAQQHDRVARGPVGGDGGVALGQQGTAHPDDAQVLGVVGEREVGMAARRGRVGQHVEVVVPVPRPP